jgi:hypothetical protein
MEDSILKSVKEVCLASPDDTSNDLEFINHINSALATVQQIGGTPGVIQIADATPTWTSVGLTDDFSGMIRAFVNLHVRLAYDPPTLGFLIDLKQKQLTELAARINTFAEVGLNG